MPLVMISNGSGGTGEFDLSFLSRIMLWCLRSRLKLPQLLSSFLSIGLGERFGMGSSRGAGSKGFGVIFTGLGLEIGFLWGLRGSNSFRRGLKLRWPRRVSGVALFSFEDAPGVLLFRPSFRPQYSFGLNVHSCISFSSWRCWRSSLSAYQKQALHKQHVSKGRSIRCGRHFSRTYLFSSRPLPCSPQPVLV